MRLSRKILFPALAILLLTAGVLPAQDRAFPYELKKRDYWLLPAGIGLSSLGSALHARRDAVTLEVIAGLDRNDVNAFDRPATFNWSPRWADGSDLTLGILVFSTVSLTAGPPLLHARWSEALTMATMLAETALLVGGAVYLTKGAVGRKRPYLYNSGLTVEERLAVGGNATSSFISGHTAAAFAAAAFVSKVVIDIHGPSPGTTLLWASSLSLAALTGYARFKSGVHYPTDAIAGAAVGFGIGWLVPVLHKKGREDRVSVAAAPNLVSVSLRF
jgi:membrane-associated phospholipid phosphatase